jgi:heme iron utilization protein
MNTDHADAIASMAAVHGEATRDEARAAGSDAGDWQMIACDPEGCDLSDGRRAVRIRFAQRITTTEAIRVELVAITRAARSSSDG